MIKSWAPNIFLTGFMGSGKSTIGRILAERLGWKSVDLDRKIEQSQNKSIKEIFETQGEEFFRKVEAETLAQLVNDKNQVVSLGGGTVLDPTNFRNLKMSGVVIFLQVSPEVIQKRVERYIENRPLLKSATPEERLEKIKTMQAERLPIYSQAHFTLRTDHLRPDEVVDLILGLESDQMKS